MVVVVAVVADGQVVHAKINGVYSTMGYGKYLQFRAQAKSRVKIVADANFPYCCDTLFESLLPTAFRLDNMWRKDLLSHWYWTRKKTGITSVYERLDALEYAGDLYLKTKK